MYTFKPIIAGKLIKGGYLDVEHQPTEKGGILIEKLFGQLTKQKGFVKPAPGSRYKKSPFMEFWTTYPKTNKYLHYPFTRTLRAGTKDRDKTKKLYLELIKKGEVTHLDLMYALNAEIEMRQKQTIIKKDNQFTYMKGIYSWLLNGYYEAWISIRDEQPQVDTNNDFYNQDIK